MNSRLRGKGSFKYNGEDRREFLKVKKWKEIALFFFSIAPRGNGKRGGDRLSYEEKEKKKRKPPEGMRKKAITVSSQRRLRRG